MTSPPDREPVELRRWVRYVDGHFILSWQERDGETLRIRHRPMTRLERIAWRIAKHSEALDERARLAVEGGTACDAAAASLTPFPAPKLFSRVWSFGTPEPVHGQLSSTV